MSVRRTKMKRILALGAIASVTMFSSLALAQEGNAEKGEKVFKKCKSCHNVGEGAKHKVGPALTGVIGRTAGTAEGYKFGPTIVAAGAAGLVWSEEEIFAYLADPKKFLREKLDDNKGKSKMAFKLKKDQDRLDVIAYLKTFSSAE